MISDDTRREVWREKEDTRRVLLYYALLRTRRARLHDSRHGGAMRSRSLGASTSGNNQDGNREWRLPKPSEGFLSAIIVQQREQLLCLLGLRANLRNHLLQPPFDPPHIDPPP